MPLGMASAAACIAAPRSATTRSASVQNPSRRRNTSAVYSPRLKPGREAATSRRPPAIFVIQRFQRRQRSHKQRRLTVDRRIELFGRTFEANLRQIVTEDLARPIEQRFRRRQRRRQLAPHAHRLSALTGKKKCSGHESKSTVSRVVEVETWSVELSLSSNLNSSNSRVRLPCYSSASTTVRPM